MAKVDPRLLKKIKEEKAGRPVQAVITLRSGPDGRPLTPEATEESVQAVIKRAQSRTARDVTRVKVFKNLQSFAVEAEPEFVQCLIDDESVDSASLNEP
jgi:hypothetical protein